MILCDPHGLERIPSQGQYPSRGDYEYAGFCYQNSELSEATVLPAVQALIRNLEELPTDPGRRMAMRVRIAAEAAKAAEKADEQWALDKIEECQPAFSGQIMSGYGKKAKSSMQRVADRLGFGQV